jgi:hypothetical protein
MKIIRHTVENPFISATGAAALVHSTWSLGTLMSGKQPTAEMSVAFIGWLVPALLIAFALDIGQIVTSSKIRHDGLTMSRGITFGVFAFATYYLQLLYCIHHVPDMQLATGVRGEWHGLVTLIRDASIWIIPMLLPLSTLLYTLSGKDTPAPAQESHSEILVMPVSDDYLLLQSTPQHDVQGALPQPIEQPIEVQLPRPTKRRSGNTVVIPDGASNTTVMPSGNGLTGKDENTIS